MAGRDTKSTILDAAEELFAEHGFAATSLRRLTARARVNLAAVHYHFGSKEDLARAVLQRRIEPVNAERSRRLAALPAAAPPAAILRAFVAPAMDSIGGNPAARQFCRLAGRLMVEQPPFLRVFLQQQFGELAGLFAARLRAVAPALGEATVWWRLHFVVGAMAHTLQNAAALEQLSGGWCAANDIDGAVEQLVLFAASGFAAPEPARGATRRTGTTANHAT